MALLCEYFEASSAEEAAETIDWIGGPSSPPEKGREAHRVIVLNGVDPTVMMGSLEELLTGRSLFEEILKDPARKPVAVRDDGDRLVIPLGPRMDHALAIATAEQLTDVAVPWSQTEEFWGQEDPNVLGPVLVELGALARDAAAHGRHLYCWVSV
jgi:hypothetical protein